MSVELDCLLRRWSSTLFSLFLSTSHLFFSFCRLYRILFSLSFCLFFFAFLHHTPPKVRCNLFMELSILQNFPFFKCFPLFSIFRLSRVLSVVACRIRRDESLDEPGARDRCHEYFEAPLSVALHVPLRTLSFVTYISYLRLFISTFLNYAVIRRGLFSGS